MKVQTGNAYIVAIVSLLIGFAWSTFFPTAPYTVMAGAVVSISTALFVKRNADAKRENDCVNGKETKEKDNGSIG